MALGPINYQMQVATPFESVLQGMSAGAKLADIEAARMQRLAQTEAARQAAVQAQAKFDREQAFETAKQSYFSNPARTGADFDRLLAQAPDKQALDALKAAGESAGAERIGNAKRFFGQLLSAIEVDPNIARQIVDERIAGEQDPNSKRGMEVIRKALEISPEFALQTTEIIGGAGLGKDWIDSVAAARKARQDAKLFGPQLTQARAAADQAVANAIKAGVDAQYAPALAVAGLGKAQAEAITAASNARFADQLNQAGLTERNWNIRAAQNRITVETARLGLDREKTTADIALTLARVGEIANSLPDQAKKDINTAAVASGTAKQQAVQFNSLADRLDKERQAATLGVGWGAFGSAAEWLSKTTGLGQDYLTQLRQEFTRLRNSAAVQSLPPGPATDRDIALVLEGFPSPTASVPTMTSFLRGMAKLQDINSAVENARVDWLTNNRGSLARARSGFQAGEFTANPGETFVDLTARISQDISNRYAAGDGGAPRQPSPAIPGAPVQPGQVAPAGRGPRPAPPASPYGGLSNDEILRRLAMPPGSR